MGRQKHSNQTRLKAFSAVSQSVNPLCSLASLSPLTSEIAELAAPAAAAAAAAAATHRPSAVSYSYVQWPLLRVAYSLRV